MEGEDIYKSWERFKELTVQGPIHGIPDVVLLVCFYKSLSPVNKMLNDQLVSGGISKQPYMIAVQLLYHMGEANIDVEKDSMLDTLITQVDELAKILIEMEVQFKGK